MNRFGTLEVVSGSLVVCDTQPQIAKITCQDTSGEFHLLPAHKLSSCILEEELIRMAEEASSLDMQFMAMVLEKPSGGIEGRTFHLLSFNGIVTTKQELSLEDIVEKLEGEIDRKRLEKE